MPTPTILFLDDQLEKSHRVVLERYLELFKQVDIDLLEAADIDVMYRILKKYKDQNKPIHGFLIDLMLPQNKPNMTFAAWGVQSLPLYHSIGGAQVIKLMRHPHYADVRETNDKLKVVKHFENSKIVLFTTFEDGESVLKNQGMVAMCDFFHKDRDNTEQLLTDWIATCNP